MSNVIDFNTKLHPVDSMVHHPKYGISEVVATEGMMRQIMYPHYEYTEYTDAEPDMDGFVDLCEETLENRDVWVHIRELTQADAAKELVTLTKLGQLPASQLAKFGLKAD